MATRPKAFAFKVGELYTWRCEHCRVIGVDAANTVHGEKAAAMSEAEKFQLNCATCALIGLFGDLIK